MPEGAEIRRAADKLAQVLEGQVVTTVRFGLPRLRRYAKQLRQLLHTNSSPYADRSVRLPSPVIGATTRSQHAINPAYTWETPLKKTCYSRGLAINGYSDNGVSTMPEPLILERQDAVAIIAINDAPYNRMSLEFIDQLEVLIGEIASDDSIRAVVLTAAGMDNFSVGMNLKQLPEGIQRKGSPDALFDQRLRVIGAIEGMRKPWIATLFGFCLGGGLELPLGCHFRLAAAEGAQIGLPEMDLGTVPAWGGSARLSKCIGRDHALDMILRARKISGPEALRIGLVHEVWPLAELKDRAIELAHELAAQPALAVRSMMEVIGSSRECSLEELLQAERRAVTATLGSPDAKEGMMAFLEKRKPVFNQ